MLEHTVLEPVGTEVHDAQVTALAEPAIAQLRSLLGRHGVVVLRGQDLDDTGFVAFLRRFGDLTFTTGETPVPNFPDLNVVSNVGRTTPPRSTFHVDTSYVRQPPAYTALRAVTIPSRGGETLFTNQYRAYDTLPAELRGRLAGRTVRHVVTGLQLDAGEESSADHPVFREHPDSGRTALYLSTPARCVAISGIADGEAAELIELLFAHSTRQDNTLRHRWEPGDLVIWDNRCVLHRADHDGVVGDRVMHRGMVAAPAAA